VVGPHLEVSTNSFAEQYDKPDLASLAGCVLWVISNNILKLPVLSTCCLLIVDNLLFFI
jgi:hypothetical protein